MTITNEVSFFRMQFDVKFDSSTREYTRPTLELCYQKPIPHPPFVENGIITIILSEYSDLKTLVEQATALAVPIAISKLNKPISSPIPE